MTGIIILAAGSSSRLGSPKQNLIYKGKTLLQKAVETALASTGRPVFVVLGANADVIKLTMVNEEVRIILNKDWEEGMASSIRAGINALQQNAPDADGVILMLCDQPFVDTVLLERLIQNESKKNIVACTYNETIGVPVILKRIHFNELLLLRGPEGAKKLLSQHGDDVDTIPFPLGGVDIDTQEDYQKIQPPK